MAVSSGSYFANSYTFTISGMPASFQSFASLIERNAIAVIDYLSDFVSWKGTLDFVVQFGSPTDFGANGTGLLPSYGGIAPSGNTYAAEEAITGADKNGATPDAGLYFLPNTNGTLTNYGSKLYFDPNPDFHGNASVPAGEHDFASIFLHEVVHSLGFWSLAQHGSQFGQSAFDKLTVIQDGQAYFVGANTVELLGRSLPLAMTGSRDHYGLDNTGAASLIDRGLMNEFGNYEQNRWQLGKVDLAVLEDLGFVVANADRLALTEQQDGGSPPGSVSELGLPGLRADYGVVLGETGVTVFTPSGGATTYAVLQRIDFTDGALVFDLSAQDAAPAYLLYGGAFDRTPDEGGLRYWVNEIASGVSLHDAAAGFLFSSEFLALYGNNLSDGQFIDQLYLNILDRAGEASGVAYWNGYLAEGQGDRASVLVNFTQLPEYVGLSQADIQNGLWVA